MTAKIEPSSVEGRPIKLTPVPRGVWLVILGGGVTALAPLFGFLIGSILGTEDTTLGMSSIYLFLFLGFLIAAVGLGIAILGVRRILRSRSHSARAARRSDQ
ncbi:hypothetical protein GCM10011608_42350 [Micromonospora sonchi]|uniref:Uncharacterized protein n=1 Tax=Micromonospora sonchi TaxID=1763543 RepID=A0A917U3L1_9ACTN|nr:hypothetical protein [Micromonospora sonchi]GGM52947.1 hypothetical protein GCM10011608_42350 [Micromonospora sonchi]